MEHGIRVIGMVGRSSAHPWERQKKKARPQKERQGAGAGFAHVLYL